MRVLPIEDLSLVGCRKYFNIFGQTGNLYGGGLHPHPHPHHFSAENRPNELSPFCGMFDVFQLFFGYTMLRKQRFSRGKKGLGEGRHAVCPLV